MDTVSAGLRMGYSCQGGDRLGRVRRRANMSLPAFRQKIIRGTAALETLPRLIRDRVSAVADRQARLLPANHGAHGDAKLARHLGLGEVVVGAEPLHAGRRDGPELRAPHLRSTRVWQDLLAVNALVI